MLNDLKMRIYRLGLDRRILAKRLGISYSTLNCKLGEFTPFTDVESKELLQILDQAEKIQVEESESEKELKFFKR